MNRIYTYSNNTHITTPKKTCTFKDSAGKSCCQHATNTFWIRPSYNNVYCQKHADICYKLRELKMMQKSKLFHNKYIYCGSHWEKCDEFGPQDIYHYISKERLGDRDIDEIDKWDYDVEIWVGDDLWAYCGPYALEKIQEKQFDPKVLLESGKIE